MSGPKKGAELATNIRVLYFHAGAITIHDVPSDLINSELGRQIVKAPRHAPFSVPIDIYRAVHGGNDTKLGDTDGVSQGACGAVQIKMHPGAIRAYGTVGHTVSNCPRPQVMLTRTHGPGVTP